MFKKHLARIEATEMGNSQAVLEYVAIAALVLGVCAAGFAMLGNANNELLTKFTEYVDASTNALNNAEKPGAGA